jgi:hypothetical protein
MNDDQFKMLLEKLDKQNEKMDELHGDFREFKGKMDEKVTTIEAGVKSDRLWGRIQTVAVLPVVGVLHQIAVHYGLIK